MSFDQDRINNPRFTKDMNLVKQLVTYHQMLDKQNSVLIPLLTLPVYNSKETSGTQAIEIAFTLLQNFMDRKVIRLSDLRSLLTIRDLLIRFYGIVDFLPCPTRVLNISLGFSNHDGVFRLVDSVKIALNQTLGASAKFEVDDSMPDQVYSKADTIIKRAQTWHSFLLSLPNLDFARLMNPEYDYSFMVKKSSWEFDIYSLGMYLGFPFSRLKALTGITRIPGAPYKEA